MNSAELNPTARFSGRAGDYARYRPGYPAALGDFFRAELSLQTRHVVADIGSGTGILTEPFLQNGNLVFAIEPNAKMRAAAEERLGHYDNFRSIDARAEETTLADGSVDLITAAQAFHWFELETTHAEFRRILRPGGHAVLLWNLRRMEGNGFARDYEELHATFGEEYQRIKRSWYVEPATLESFFGHRDYGRRSFDNAQEVNYEGLRGYLLSSSFAPAPGHPDFPTTMENLRALFEKHNQSGRVTIEYETRVYWGRLK